MGEAEWTMKEGELSHREYHWGDDIQVTERSHIYCKMKGPEKRRVDFDLKLFKKKVNWRGRIRWRKVAVSQSWGSNERIRVRRNKGTYKCLVVSYKGSGAYKMEHTVSAQRLRRLFLTSLSHKAEPPET